MNVSKPALSLLTLGLLSASGCSPVPAAQLMAVVGDVRVLDGGSADAGIDSGVSEAGVADAGAPDSGVADAGLPDAGERWRARRLATGGFHSCGVVSGAGVFCWGDNLSGQIGNGTFDIARSPTAVPGLGVEVASVALGFEHSCAVLDGGQARCWGKNNFGQVGDGSKFDRPLPAVVSGLVGASSIAPGDGHTCALMLDQTVKCWGDNSLGQMGNGGTAQSLVPQIVPGLDQVTAITTGTAHSCALKINGDVLCWGRNEFGAIGVSAQTSPVRSPTLVPLGGPASRVHAGSEHTCAVMRAGTVQCWGWNKFGQLGNNSLQNQPLPVQVGGIQGEASALSIGGSTSCVLTSTGASYCWGENRLGQFGNGGTASSIQPVLGKQYFGELRFLDVGGSHGCGASAAGAVHCWGNNAYGQLGIGQEGGVPVVNPALIPGFPIVE